MNHVAIIEFVGRGLEDLTRECFGDDAVDRAIREDLQADGWDPGACFECGNGYERRPSGAPVGVPA